MVPVGLTFRVFKTGGKLAWFFAGRRRRRIGDENLKRCLPELSASQRKAVLQESLVSLALFIPEVLCHRQLGQDLDQWYQAEGEELLEEARASKRGFFIGTSHFGTWGMAWLTCHLFEPSPLGLIIKRQENPYLDRFINRWITAFRGVRLADKGAGKAVVEAVESGSIIGFYLDQAALPHQGRYIDFFGQPALTHIVPFYLAHKHDIPFFPIFMVRTGPGRCRAIVRPALPLVHTDDIIGDVTRMAEAMHREMEAVIREYPGMYLWMHDRFKRAPEDGAKEDDGAPEEDLKKGPGD
jgi:KDO2-lipid IV(A) lauroyltransferase